MSDLLLGLIGGCLLFSIGIAVLVIKVSRNAQKN
jgi:hypothetical protein